LGLGLLYGLSEPGAVPASEADRVPVRLAQRSETSVASGVVTPPLTASGSTDDEGFAVSTAEVTEIEQPDRMLGCEDDGFVLLPVGVFSIIEAVF
jgi:hypothetical protein